MYRKREDDFEEKEYKVEKKLGKGSFNCTHLVVKRNSKEKSVLRLALLLAETENDILQSHTIKRGLAIVDLLQNMKKELGPACLIQTAPFEIIDSVDIEKLVDLSEICNEMVTEAIKYNRKRVPYDWAVQHIELLAGDLGSPYYATELVPIMCLSLIWFFFVAQRRIDLRHHDLKLQNIMVRKYDIAKTFQFVFKSKGVDVIYKFTTDLVPVVIDFDFATVKTTEDYDDRTRVGTRMTTSPQALAHTFFVENPTQFRVDSNDWWSLGLTLYFYATQQDGGNIDKYFAIGAAFANSFGFTDGDEFDILSYFLVNMVFIETLTGEEFNNATMPHFNELVLDKLEYWNKMSIAMKKYEKPIIAKLDKNLLNLLVELFRWTSRDGNDYMRLLAHTYFSNLRTFSVDKKIADTYFTDSGPVSENYQQLLQRTPLLKECLGCGLQNGLKRCTCCLQIFCGEQCQIKHH